MQKWEYVTFTAAYATKDDLGIVKFFDGKELQGWKDANQRRYVVDFLDEMGEQGWELVSVMWRPAANTVFDPIYYLKRPKG